MTEVPATFAARPSFVAVFVPSPLATIRLLVVAPVVSVSEIPLCAELYDAVIPTAAPLIASITSSSVSADARSTLAVDDLLPAP